MALGGAIRTRLRRCHLHFFFVAPAMRGTAVRQSEAPTLSLLSTEIRSRARGASPESLEVQRAPVGTGKPRSALSLCAASRAA